eukprot:gene26867-biopygen17452
MQVEAATSIQSVYRAHLRRRHYRDLMVQNAHVHMEAQLRNHAAFTIARFW